jgi:hypothetical protein
MRSREHLCAHRKAGCKEGYKAGRGSTSAESALAVVRALLAPSSRSLNHEAKNRPQDDLELGPARPQVRFRGEADMDGRQNRLNRSKM